MTARHLIATATAAALAAVPAIATGNVAATCTTTGVKVTLSGFGHDQVPWTVTQAGRVLASGTQSAGTTTTFPVALAGVTGTVTVRAQWGPHITRDVGTATTQAGCTPPPPAPTSEPTPAAYEPPPAPAPPNVTIAPPINATPPRPAPLSCRDLAARNVGRAWLLRRGCIRTSSTSIKRCRPGTWRVVVKGRAYCLATNPRPTRPAVTG